VEKKSFIIDKSKSRDEEGNLIEITTEQLSQKAELIIIKIADHLFSQKLTVRRLFKSIIFSHQVNSEEFYEAIPLKNFLDVLKQINFKYDLTDVYCIFTKLKYNDEYETIDLNKLIDEMENYGIFEKTDNILGTNELFNKIYDLTEKTKFTFEEIEQQISSHITIKDQDTHVIKIDNLLNLINSKLNNSYTEISKECMSKIGISAENSSQEMISFEKFRSDYINYVNKK